MDIIDDCCGSIVLGYPQMQFRHEVKRSTQTQNSTDYVFPTPWNQIEGALAYRASSPKLVVAHPVEGGVVDHGVTGEAVLHVDLTEEDWYWQAVFSQPFDEWVADVEQCLRRSEPAA